MKKKTTFKDFKRDYEVGDVVCPKCYICSVFKLKETKQGYLKFICNGCGFGEVMPFKKGSR